MDNKYVYVILKDIIGQLSTDEPGMASLPDTPPLTMSLADLGLDLSTLPMIREQLKSRMGGKEIRWDFLDDPMQINSTTLGELLDETTKSLGPNLKDPIVVYVDDEEENLFVFKRKFGSRLRLVTFTEPRKAFEFIRSNEDVRVVITDEVMPGMSGNELCDEVHKIKPSLGFILITGNPNSDSDLMYNSLKRNRFFEFINKPVDFAGKGEEYYNMILSLAFFGRN